MEFIRNNITSNIVNLLEYNQTKRVCEKKSVNADFL